MTPLDDDGGIFLIIISHYVNISLCHGFSVRFSFANDSNASCPVHYSESPRASVARDLLIQSYLYTDRRKVRYSFDNKRRRE